VKKGPKAGSQFLGCEDYPKCRFSKDIPQQAENELIYPWLKLIIVFIVIFIFYYISG